MGSEQIKSAAYVILCVCLGFIMYRALMRRDYASALMALSAFIAGYLLRVQIV